MNNQKSLLQKGAILSISLMLTSSQAINGVIPQMKQSLGISQSQSELLGTAPSITVILFILLSSYFAKRIGMKKTIILGLLLAGIGGIIPVFTATFQTVLISRVILGAGLGVYNSLAVTYISSLYSGNTRATLLGIRNSMEALGQTILIFLAGVLVNINWTASFLVYAIAFPVALLFALKVPEIRDENSDIPENHVKEKMNPMVFALVLFAILLVMNSIAISVRFASIATEIKGVNFNASNYLALMPILGILAGFMFGPINKWIGKGTLYLGIKSQSELLGTAPSITVILFILLSSYFAKRIGMKKTIILGLLLAGIGGIIPVFTATFQTVLISRVIGNFIAPIAMQLAQFLTRSTNLTAPFFVFAGIFIVILFVTFFATNKKNTRVTRGAS
ncbi:hypothetical protein EfmAA290_30260 (plasmid) [Enterococcus faecium]|nr:hypothetical protein EfmAA290_30260 [Enterococcus faecium]